MTPGISHHFVTLTSIEQVLGCTSSPNAPGLTAGSVGPPWSERLLCRLGLELVLVPFTDGETKLSGWQVAESLNPGHVLATTPLRP